MKWSALFLTTLLIAGCTDRDRDDAIDQGAAITKRVVNATVSATTEAWRRACGEAAKLTPESGRAALRSAEKGLEDAKEKLEPGKGMQEAEAQIARLRAALDIDLLRHEMDEKEKRAEKLKENADKSAQDVREELAAVDRDYRDLQRKLTAAQNAYDAAREKVDELAASLRS